MHFAVTLVLSLCIGVFSDVLNLIFRDKSSRQITSDGVEVVGNISLDTTEMEQREHILAKCLQFLRLLARYIYISCYIMFMLLNIVIGTIQLFKNACLIVWMIYSNLMLPFQKWLIYCLKCDVI